MSWTESTPDKLGMKLALATGLLVTSLLALRWAVIATFDVLGSPDFGGDDD